MFERLRLHLQVQIQIFQPVSVPSSNYHVRDFEKPFCCLVDTTEGFSQKSKPA